MTDTQTHVYTADGRRLYTQRQVAELLDVPYSSLGTWRDRGQFPDPDLWIDGRTPLWTEETAQDGKATYYYKIQMTDDNGRTWMPDGDGAEGVWRWRGTPTDLAMHFLCGYVDTDGPFRKRVLVWKGGEPGPDEAPDAMAER